ELEHIESPDGVDDAAYMSFFTGKIGSLSPDCVFSTVFYRILSLACGVLELRYVVWIAPGYNENNYSYQINNDRDWIYVADKQLYDYYGKRGLTNVKYLPIPCSGLIEVDQPSHEEHTEAAVPVYDVSVITPCTYPAGSIADYMTLLRDSTKGYLDGIVEARKNDLNHNAMYSRFADYIKEDIKEHYPMTDDSYESPEMKYDNRVFFPHIDRSFAIGYVLALISMPEVMKLALYTPSGFPYCNEKLDVILVDTLDEVIDCISKTRLVVCIPPIQDGTELPLYVYRLIDMGYAVVMPDILDRDVTEEMCIPTFRNGNNYAKLINHYLSAEEELNKLRNRQHEALNNRRSSGVSASNLFDL
ncbi:MAG: hypothetical protein IK123_12020, partial [Lachnospiraceae bacterium]|nr:hypothetical protein [Lachnospiraceae bacterium]